MVNLKKISLIILLILTAFLFSSCDSNERLTHLVIVQAIGIDCNENGVSVSIQYLDINKGTGTNEGVKGNITAVVNGKGRSIASAITEAEKTLSGKLFFGQNKLFVFGKGSDEKLGNALKSFLLDTTKSRPDVLVAESYSEAEEVIKNKQRGSRVPAESLCLQLETEGCEVRVNDYLNSLDKTKIPVIKATEDYTVVLK